MPTAPAQLATIYKPRLLIGEGEDEANFFRAFLKHHGITDIQVEQYGGKTKLNVYIRELRRRPGHHSLKALGVTRDTDTDCAGAFSSVAAALRAGGYPVPAAAGQHARTQQLNVGVFLMPDNARPGMLEDLCLSSVAPIDPAYPCLQQFFDCVQKGAGRQPGNVAKAMVHAWLATQAEPDCSLGVSALKHYWPFTHAAFQPLAAFIQAL